MPATTIQLLKGDQVADDTDYIDALPVNVSGVVRKILGVDGYMLQQPGLKSFTAGSGIDRGGIWNERLDLHFRVSGTDLITVDENGVTSTLGTITGSDTASLPYSFNTQAVIADGKCWLYSPSSGFNEITDTDLGSPIDGVWVDGYYFFTDGENIYHSDLSDETSIDPLKFATAEFSPDPTMGVGLTNDNKVIVFGRYTIEYFVNEAQDNFSFTRLPSRAVKIGLVGTHAKTEVMGAWYILGGPKNADTSVYGVKVGQFSEIASRRVVEIINTYDEGQLETAVMEHRIEDKISYLILHLPSDTLLYNFQVAEMAGNEQAWSILKTDVAGDQTWRAIHGVYDPRRAEYIYGDKRDDTIGCLDDSIATHYGDLAECIIYTPFQYLDSLSIDELQIQTIPGFNTVDDANVFVSLTYNGVTWSMEKTVSYGGPSEYGARFIVYRLGYVDNYCAFKLRWAATSRMAFSAATMVVN